MQRTWKFNLSALLVGAFVIVFYLGCVTLGLWKDFPPFSHYYDLQASAFRQGQLALEVQPDPALLALPNPYEPASREGLTVLWDATLYQGKYYLYWGPVPALLIAPLKFISARIIGDNLLTFLFLSGTFFFLALILVEVWQAYFPEIPQALILASLALAGLINPLPYVLIEARIYEAAIVAGQCFLLGGLYFLFRAFHQPERFKLALAGTCFALAVGSRTTLALPVGLLALIFVCWSFKNHKDKLFSQVGSLAAPLILGALLYAWYNFARFGSITEFGYSYQLTGFNIHAQIQDTFALAYLPPNLFKTLLNPLELNRSFPFIKAALWGGPPSWLSAYAPKIYFYLSEGLSGLLVASPFLIFAFLKKPKELFWISISLTASALSTFLLAQIFFYAAMRYLLDFVPALTLLGIFGLWSRIHLLKSVWAFKALAFMLWAYTIFIGVVLPLSSNVKRLKAFNPELVLQLINLFK
ncbi:MAG: hypothetical protein IT310_10290 [Anaerolineales bacterium]|nr:hypothetical protein [Anaerolineales bacterium]